MFKFIISFIFIISSLQADDNPFYIACTDKPIETEGLNTSFMSNNMPEVDKVNKITAFTLLNRLKDKVENKIEGTERLLSSIEYCKTLNDEACDELLYWLYIEVPKYAKDLRKHAALAQSPHNLNSWFKKTSLDINDDLSLWSINKIESWESLTSKESFEAKQKMQKYSNKTKNKLDELLVKEEIDKDDIEELYNKIILDIRLRHYNKYQTLLGSVHLFQYISSANPSREDIESALIKLKNNLEIEKEYISKIKTELSTLYQTTMNVSNNILEILNYQSLLEEFLLENPKYCNLAAALMKYRSRRALKQTLAIALPIMVSSFVLPPLSGIAVGAIAGGAYATHSQLNLMHKTQINMSKVYASETGIELSEVSQLKRQRDFDILMMPLGLGLISGMSSKITPKIFRHSTKIGSTLTKSSDELSSISKFVSTIKKYSKINLKN